MSHAAVRTRAPLIQCQSGIFVFFLFFWKREKKKKTLTFLNAVDDLLHRDPPPLRLLVIIIIIIIILGQGVATVDIGKLQPFRVRLAAVPQQPPVFVEAGAEILWVVRVDEPPQARKAPAGVQPEIGRHRRRVRVGFHSDQRYGLVGRLVGVEA